MRVPQVVRKRKKTRVLGEPRVMSREAYEALELDVRLELIRALIPIGLSQVEEELKREVISLAGTRYSRKSGEAGYLSRELCPRGSIVRLEAALEEGVELLKT